MKTAGSETRVGAGCAFAGSAVLSVGTYLHPLNADPNDALAAFTEYAADRLWVTSHLLQLAGVVLIVVALLVLARELEAARGSGWPRIAAGGAIATLALTAALQAVDGVALKVVVDSWASAPAAQKPGAFQAAFAVRQVEIGLASMLGIVFGLTTTVYGVGSLVDGVFPKWMGALAVAGGAPMAVAGVVTAYTGFSGLAMGINMPASVILLGWMLGVGAFLWRRGR